MAAPKIVNIHFCYHGGFGLDKNGFLDSAHASFSPPVDTAREAIFILEFDQPLDSTAINTLVSSGTYPVGVVSDSQISSITGISAWRAGVYAAGFINYEYWLHYDELHNFSPISFDANGLGAFTGPGNLNLLNSNLSSSVPFNHCTYVRLPAGRIQPGHRYGLWYIPEHITAGGVGMAGSPPGEPASKATWNQDYTELRLDFKGTLVLPDTTKPEIVSITPSTGTNLTAYEGKDVQVNSSLAIKFSEDVSIASNAFFFSKEADRGAVYSNWSLGIPYTISYDSSTYTATLTPNSPLDPGEKYLLAHYTNTRTQDGAGNSLEGSMFTAGYEFTTLAASSPPKIVNIHFYYSGGSALDKNGLLDDVTSAYQVPNDPAKAPIYLLEFDTVLDDVAINALTGSTPPIGILDDTQVQLTGFSSFMTAVSGAGYGMDWWKYYDEVHNFTPTSSGAFNGTGPISSALNSNLSSSVPMNRCMYFALPAGTLKAGHRYLIWHIPEYITAGGTMMTRHAGAGVSLSARTSAGPSHTELRLQMETASAPPVLKGFHVAYPSDTSLSGKTKSLPQNVDITTPSYQVPVDNTHSPCFYLEYDQALDNHAPSNKSRIQLREEGGSVVLGLLDVTEINKPIVDGGFVGGLSGYLNVPYPYLTQDGVYSLRGTTKVTSDTLSNETGGVVTPFDSTLSHHCVYFQVDPGQLKEGHVYNLFRRPNEIDNIAGDQEDSSWSSNDPAAKFGILWKTEADTSAPTIVSKTPANAATNVSVNASITVTFSEEVTLPVGQNVTYSSVNQAGNWISQPAHVVYSSKTVTITPTNPLPGTSIINVAVPTGVTDSAGNALAPQSWSFMTAAPPDTRVPIEAYAIGFTKDPDNFKSIPLTKSGSIDIDFKIPADDIDGSKIMYLRLRDENGLISPNYRISLRVNDVEFKTFEIDSDPYLIGSVNNVDVRFDIDNTDVSGFQYGYLVDDSSEPTTWASPVITTNSINEYLFNFNLDVSALIAGEHELYVWIKTKEGEKRFRKINFVSEPAVAPPYGTIGIKRSLIEDGKKKVWVEANVFDDGVGVKELSLEDTAYPDNLVNINIIQNKRYLKIFEYDALDNSVRNYKLILVDAIGTYNATPITTSVDLSSVF